MSNARSLFPLLPLLAAGALVGCVSLPRTAPVPHPPSQEWIGRAESRWPDTSEAELLLGRRLFMERCNECHRHPDVTYLPEQQWPTTMVQMGKYAKLTDAERKAVFRFILTARASVFGHSSAFVEPEEPSSEEASGTEAGPGG